MHSVDFITLSRRPERVELLAKSIDFAMGSIFSHKLTVVDGTRHDLFTGYNAGAAQTRAEILVFVHDDVQFLGNPMVFQRPFQMLKQLATGFIGIVGARFVHINGIWWGDNLKREHILKHTRGLVINKNENPFGMHAMVWPGPSAEFGQVMVADGVMLMCHRRTFNRLNGFDSSTFKGFHFYDVDTTFRAHKLGLKNYAAPIPLLHASLGNYDAAWDKNRRIFAEKHKASLPCAL